jgi:S1-C subfamily serine protease
MAFVLGLVSVRWVLAQSPNQPSSTSGKSARQIAQEAFPSVALLMMQDSNGQPRALGSGFVLREGLIVTNVHVIAGAASGYVKLVGESRRFPIAGTVAVDEAHDLAICAVNGLAAPGLEVLASGDVSVGDEVYAVGNPEGLEGTFSQGIISAIRRARPDTVLQMTAPISPGSSGGPVLDKHGTVVGIAVATFSEGQNLNLAVPSTYLC